jgi:hypothetical protein
MKRLKNSGKYDSIDFTPPQAVRNNAEKGLELRRKQSPSNKGGLSVQEAAEQGVGSGVQRAVNLKNGDPVSPEVAKRMKAFFSRFQGHLSKSRKLKSEDEQLKSKMYVSDLIWGGKAGEDWAKKIVKQMEEIDSKKEATVKKTSSALAKNTALFLEGYLGDLSPGQLKGLDKALVFSMVEVFEKALSAINSRNIGKYLKVVERDTAHAYGPNSSLALDCVKLISLYIPFNSLSIFEKVLKSLIEDELNTDSYVDWVAFERFLGTQNIALFFKDVLPKIKFQNYHLEILISSYVDDNMLGTPDVDFDDDTYNEMPDDYDIKTSPVGTGSAMFDFRLNDPRQGTLLITFEMKTSVDFDF